MKIILCGLCGRKTIKSFIKRKESSLSKCQNCGLIFINPQPSQKKLDQIYQKEYFKAKKKQKNSISYGNYLDQKSAHISYFKKKISQIKKIKKKGKILDIGCALGFFLEVAKNAGYKVTGIDISKFAIDYIKKNLGFNARCGQLEKLRFSPNSFDVVTLFGTIEHIKNPYRLFKKIRKILKPNGILIITTPDCSSSWARLLGKYWWGYNHKIHLFIFSKKTIKSILKRIGFKNIEIKKDFPIYISIKDILIRLKLKFGWKFTNRLIYFLGPIGKWNFIPFPGGMSITAIG